MPDPILTTKAELLQKINLAWASLIGFLEGLTENQMKDVRDAQGWNVQDHVIHLAVWEDSITALFRGKPRHEALEIEESLYATATFDELNALIRERTKDVSLPAAIEQLQRKHNDLMAAVGVLSDADLKRPVREFFPQAPPTDERRVFDILLDNTAQHFSEHLAWMEALLGYRV